MAKSNDDNPATPPSAPDPWAVIDRLTTALERLGNAPKEEGSRTEQLMETLSTALVRLSETQLEGSKLIASETRRAHRPSNEVPPLRSEFNRRGVLVDDPKPPLKCIMLIPWIAEWESCTREEVELLNLLEAGEYTVSLSDRSKIKVGIKVDYKLDGVTPSRLLLNNIAQDGTAGTAFNNDNFRMMPALSDMLRQILRQHSTEIRQQSAAVLTDEEEEAMIEAGQLSVSV